MFSLRFALLTRIKSVIDLLVSGAAFLFLDQWSKRLVQLRSAAGPITLVSLVRIRCVANSRSLYRQNSVRALLALLWVAALGSTVILHGSGAAFQSRASLLGLGAAFGGAAGNLLDIFRSRSVADFIDLGWWPVFNVADVAIVVGLVIAFWPA